MPGALRVGCQTFTWEMLGERWTGGPDDLLDAIAAAGYAGIEITDNMIGAYAGRPAAFGEALSARGLSLVAFAIGSPSGFTQPDRTAADLEAVSGAIAFLSAFPGAVLSLGSATATSPGGRDDKFSVAADFYNRAAALGSAAGVDVAVHPSSHHDTLLFDRDDYDRIFALLDPGVGWVPDTGHLLRGHRDMLDTLRRYQGRIRYLHLKDADAGGTWAMLGAGACDMAAVIGIVSAAPRFNGWLVLEEESDLAATDPAAAVRANRATMRALGY